MSDQDNVFDGVQEEQPVTPPVNSDNRLNDLLASIKNENGEQKFKTIEDALKGYTASQEFIGTLKTEKSTVEQELNQLREQAARQQSIEEVLKNLTAKDEQEKPAEKTPPASGLSEEAVAKLVRDQIALMNSEQKYVENVSTVQNTLKQKYGDKTRETVAAKAKELGTTPEQLGELSKSNPQLVLALFNSSKPASNPTSPSSFNLPRQTERQELAAPEKSLLLGATSRDQKAYMQRIKEDVYKKHNVEV